MKHTHTLLTALLLALALAAPAVGAEDVAQNPSASAVQGDSAAGILPSQRIVKWEPGLNAVGGVPSASWPIHATLSPSGGDDTAAINKALAEAGAVASAASPRVVKLAAGTFSVIDTIWIRNSYVVLRGTAPTNFSIGGGDGTKIIPTPTQDGFTVIAASCGTLAHFAFWKGELAALFDAGLPAPNGFQGPSRKE